MLFRKNLFYIFLFLVLFSTEISGQENGPGKITGRITGVNGESMSGGLVSFFNLLTGPPPSREKYWRVPDLFTAIKQDGGFSMELPPGKYYLGAIKRASGSKELGPPEEGDLFYAASENGGSPRAYEVKSGQETDLGTIAAAAPFSKKEVDYKNVTAVEGTVIDPEGHPVAGALVFAYVNPSMTGRPLFVSEKTGTDGKFMLRVSGAGTYYLKVRGKYGGGMPSGSELVGVYGNEQVVGVKKPGVGIILKKGDITRGITITATRFGERPRGTTQ